MKKRLLLLPSLVTLLSLPLFADYPSRAGYGANPVDILDTVADKANEDYYISESKFNDISSQTEQYDANPNHRITNTLYTLKNKIHPYLQRTLYLGLTAATILLIYNGFLLVTNGIHEQGEFSKIKGNLIPIGIGVIILTGFYFLLDLIIAIMNFLFT
jgi:hypothetical protein